MKLGNGLKMVRTRITRRRGGERGFVLVEVLAAVVLSAVLIVPLTTTLLSVADNAAGVRDQAARLPMVTAGSATRTAWDWGPMVGSLRWGSGPAVKIELEGLVETEGFVGMWADGWFLGEWSPDGDQAVEVPASTWSGLEGRELTIRVRRLDGCWGPPWRSSIPPEDREPAASIAMGLRPTEGDGPSTGQENVVHVHGLTNPDIEILQPGGVLHVEPLGLVFYTLPSPSGLSDIRLDDLVQSWRAEDGRALDLYF